MVHSEVLSTASQYQSGCDETHIEYVSSFDVHRATVRFGSSAIIGPIYPIDAFSEYDQNWLRSAIEENSVPMHRIRGRAYVTRECVAQVSRRTGITISLPREWEEDLESVTAELSGFHGLVWSNPIDAGLFLKPESSVCSPSNRRAAENTVPGPIAPITSFGNEQQQVLRWSARVGHIPALMLNGLMYVSYWDVYGRLLSSYFESDFDHPAAWDGTYSETWSSWRRIGGAFVKPRGFNVAMPSEFLPRIRLGRETYRELPGFHTPFVQAAYPRHIVSRAAEMLSGLCQLDGFLERFRAYRYDDAERDANAGERVQPLSSFDAYEAACFRKLAAEGSIRIFKVNEDEYISVADLMYYEMFAAEVIVGEYEFPEEMCANETFEVMFDGRICRRELWGAPTYFVKKRNRAANL